MSLSEAIITGLSTTVIGLLIVFAVLFILMIVLKVFERVFAKPEKNAKPENTAVVKNSVADESVEDEGELIAVLTAAIAASLNTSTYNLKIKSYRRIHNNAPAWNKAGLEDTINSRLN